MAYFKLDIYKSEDAIQEFKRYKDNCLEELEILYGSLDGVESCWNDNNSKTFRQSVANDKSKISSYFSSLDVLCSKLANFNDELKKIVTSFGFSGNTCIVKFDDSQVNECINKLSNVIYYLNNAVYIINNSLLNSSYKNKNHLYNLRNQLYNAVNITNEIKGNFEKYIKLVSELLEKYKDQINDIENLNLNVEKLQYRSNVIDLN